MDLWLSMKQVGDLIRATSANGEMRLVKTADKKVGAAVVVDPQRLILAITFLTRVTA
jgi:hypothetical protein